MKLAEGDVLRLYADELRRIPFNGCRRCKGLSPNLSGKRTEVLTDYSDFQSAVCCRLFFFTNRLCFIADKKESI